MPAFTVPPSLMPLYAKAALTTPLHRGESLPSTAYELADQRIDANHLAAYQKVCGFPVAGVLPATYLHVLAFPLSVALMTEAAFPFPIVGLVHVNNTITVARPVTVEDEVTLSVRATDLRPHPAGRQFDVIAAATVADELVWSGRSTYLRRGKPSEPKDQKPKDQKRAPAPLAGGLQLRVPADIGRRYGAISGDRNPIHMYRLTAKALGFPSAIAHGMWLKARTLATLQGRLPDAFAVDVAFKLPVFLPATVAIGTTQTDDGWALDVRSVKSGKPHLAGKVTRG
jgi:acyl dehydratase